MLDGWQVTATLIASFACLHVDVVKYAVDALLLVVHYVFGGASVAATRHWWLGTRTSAHASVDWSGFLAGDWSLHHGWLNIQVVSRKIRLELF